MRRSRPKSRGRALLPELEPAEGAHPRRSRPEQFSAVVARLQTQFREVLADPDIDNPVARGIVYFLNVVLMILAFPVGFAMLIFNVLRGESLRTTVHVLALTGVAAALASTEMGAGLLGLN